MPFNELAPIVTSRVFSTELTVLLLVGKARELAQYLDMLVYTISLVLLESLPIATLLSDG